MRAIRTASSLLIAAGATAAALALTAPAAGAAAVQPITTFGFAITPSTVAPGGRVTLTVTGCDAAYASASSGVFDTVSIPRGRPAQVVVDRDARRGARYSVSFTCNGETGSADLTIATASTPTTSSTTVSRGVRGGLGGSVSGAEPAEIAAGAGLFLVAAAGATYAVRRRTASRRH